MNDKDIKEISCGSYHSIIYKKNGDLFVFGNNEYGQLGIGNEEDKNNDNHLIGVYHSK